MKWMKVAVVVMALASWAMTSQAQQSWRDKFAYESSVDKFGANEFQVDMFGTYASRDRFGLERDRWGGGLGLNYFPSKYLGVGADSYLEEWKWPYRLNGSLIFRLPVEELGMAPYVFGGAGREWKYQTTWTAHAGVGLEFRFNRNFGIFADGRRVFDIEDRHGDDLDYWLARAGIRFSF
jgi:opacity protein-like surface antigen